MDKKNLIRIIAAIAALATAIILADPCGKEPDPDPTPEAAVG